MKLTPEQKAFRDYGKALGRLEECRRSYHFTVSLGFVRRCVVRGDYVSSTTRNFVARHMQLIRDAWEKRAACRGWLIPDYERICENCAHGGTAPFANPCSECFRSPFAISSEMVSDNWEPGKEGE